MRMPLGSKQYIGELPQGWKQERLNNVADLYGRIGWQGLTSDEYQDEGPWLVTGTDFQDGTIDWDSCVHISDKRWEEAYQIKLTSGDLLITKDGTVGKLAIVENQPGKASLNSGVMRIVPKDSISYATRFLYYVLQTDVFKEWFKDINAGASTIQHLFQKDFKQFVFPVPPMQEQEKIVSALDAKCSEIDSSVGTIGNQVSALERYQASVIHEAVTKGLNPNVPMKSSGIDWIGNIPEKWEVKRLKYVINFFDNLRAPIEASLRSQEGEILYPYYGASGAIDVIDDYNVTGEMLLVGEDGANLVRRTLPLVYLAAGRYWVNNHAHILHPISGNIQYYFHALEACDYTLYITGSAQPKLSQQNLMNVWLPVPPVDEQVAIGDYLNSRIVAIDTVLETKRKQIDVLKRRRQSLIYECVTGKRRVGKEI